jgi:16S rRNA (uracil1498-N3)-methyltransferase
MTNKKLRRFFVEEIEAQEGSFSIVGSEAKHISRVLRMGPGEQFILMDAKGHRFLALIESISGREVGITLLESLPRPSSSPIQIILYQALLKSRQMDYLIQKTSELGVDRILPFISERTVVNLKKDRTDNKLRHWGEIARSAATQSDRVSPAQIEPLSSFQELMEGARGGDEFKVILWEEEGSKDLKSLLRASEPRKRLVGVIGPEGGFSREEIEAATYAGFIPVSMGQRILRAETAALTLVAIVQYEWGDLSLSNS